jgi:putative Mn2+ efflux pump MntP
MQSLLLCSIDSFLAALGIGLLERSESRNRQFIIAFAACDLISTLAGLTWRSTMAQLPPVESPLVVAPLLLAVVAAAMLAYSQKLPAVFISIPILLSLDNFVAGLLDGSLHAFPSPLIAALASGLLAAAGFTLARVARPRLSQLCTCLAGVGLLILAFFN